MCNNDFNQRAIDITKNASTIFVQKLTKLQEGISLEQLIKPVEEIINTYIRTGQYPQGMKQFIEGNGYQQTLFRFLKEAGSGREIKVVLERTAIDPQQQHNAETEKFNAEGQFFLNVPEAGKQAMIQYLQKWDNYFRTQEENVTQQIMAFNQPLVAILGYPRHLAIPEIVKKQKPIEIFYATPNYPQSYDHQMIQEFRKNGTYSDELYFRRMIEFMVMEVLKSNIPPEKNVYTRFIPTAHYYARSLTQGGMNVVRAIPLMESENLWSSWPALNRAFEREGLMSLETALETENIEEIYPTTVQSKLTYA